MDVYPAIDLIDGGVVRLWKGRFDRATTYESAPADIAGTYADAGARTIHVVDLDGARAGRPSNLDVLEAVTQRVGEVAIQWGGGLRDAESVASVLAAGASRAIVGSVAVRNPDTVGEWIARFGADRIVVALDVRAVVDDPLSRYVTATAGWTKSDGGDLWSLVDALAALGVHHVLSTDINRDGTGHGPNLSLYSAFVERYPDLAIQASGGVGSRDDLVALRSTGVSAVVVGKSLLDGTLSLAEAMS